MHLKVISEDKEKLKIEVSGDSQTLTQMISRAITDAGGDAAAIREHPFMKEPEILIMGPKPKKVLQDASQSLIDQLEEFENNFSNALKK